jgi:hypothetical protein
MIKLLNQQNDALHSSANVSISLEKLSINNGDLVGTLNKNADGNTGNVIFDNLKITKIGDYKFTANTKNHGNEKTAKSQQFTVYEAFLKDVSFDNPPKLGYKDKIIDPIKVKLFDNLGEVYTNKVDISLVTVSGNKEYILKTKESVDVIKFEAIKFNDISFNTNNIYDIKANVRTIKESNFILVKDVSNKI